MERTFAERFVAHRVLPAADLGVALIGHWTTWWLPESQRLGCMLQYAV